MKFVFKDEKGCCKSFLFFFIVILLFVFSAPHCFYAYFKSCKYYVYNIIDNYTELVGFRCHIDIWL